MKSDQFQAELSEIEAKIKALPRDQRTRLLPLVEETIQRHGQLTEGFAGLHDIIDNWRLTMKYLVFDLERTRHQVEQLRTNESGD